MRPVQAATRRAAVALALLLAACGGGGDGNGGTGPGPTETTLAGILSATNGAVGTLELTVAGDITAPRVAAAGGRLPAARVVLNLSGTLSLATGGTVNVTGTWDTGTGAVSFTGGGYSFTGSYATGALSGTFTGPAIDGVFTMTVSSGTAGVTTYCGTFTGTDGNGDPENGLLSLAVSGGQVYALLVISTSSYALTGTVSGSIVTLSIPSGSATGTISGSSVSGSYTAGGSSGSWQASVNGCTGATGGTVATVTLNPATWTLNGTGDSVLVFATATDAGGGYVANAAFAWSVLPAGIVAVHPVPGRTDAAWVVGLAGTGTATVSATVGAVAGTGSFTIPAAGRIWSSVSTGALTTCGLTSDPVTNAGLAWCWGDNSQGQLGDGTNNPYYAPHPVSAPAGQPMPDWRAIQTSGSFTCGLDAAGKIWCWGSNADGRLGHGPGGNALLPTAVTLPAGVTIWDELSVGNSHACARAGTALYCWGYNGYGKLGDHSSASRDVPTRVADPAAGAVTWEGVSAGVSHTCAVSSSFEAYCWGYGGNLGTGNTNPDSIPVKVAMPVGVSFLTVNAGQITCAVSTTNAGYCWGVNAGHPMTGDPAIGANSTALSPNLIPGGRSWLAFAQGMYNTCGLEVGVPDPSPYCWGSNFTGQLGDNSANTATAPVAPAGGHHFIQVDAFYTHTCGVEATGQLYCWGQNISGQLGLGSTGADVLVPTLVP